MQMSPSAHVDTFCRDNLPPVRGPNTPWLVVCWLGVVKAGGVVVTTMPLLRPGELTVICRMARIRLALCDHRFVDDLAAADVPALRIVTYGSHGAQDAASTRRSRRSSAGR